MFKLLCFITLLNAAVFGFGQSEKLANFKHFKCSDYGVEKLIFQNWDSNGNFWAVTAEGLLRHNGVRKKIFPYDSSSTESVYLASPNIQTFTETKTDEFWITYTDTNIITQVNAQNEEFTHHRIDSLNTNGELTSLAIEVELDKNGDYWLVTWNKGLMKLDLEKETQEIFQFGLREGEKPRNCRMKDIFELESGEFLITFFNEAAREKSYPAIFNPDTKSYSRLDIESYIEHHDVVMQKQIKVAISIVHFVEVDLNGNYWFGTYSGLLFMDNEKHTLERVSTEGVDKAVQNQANAGSGLLIEDELWVATPNLGVLVVNIYNRQITVLKNNPKNTSSLTDNQVSSISVDPQNNIWVCNGPSNLSVYVPFIHNFKIMYWSDMELAFTNTSVQKIPVSQIVVKNSHEIYVGSKPGIDVYDGHSLKVVESFHFESFETEYKKRRGVENFKLSGDKIYLTIDGKPHTYDIQTKKLFKHKNGARYIAFRHDTSITDYFTQSPAWYGASIWDMRDQNKTKELIRFPKGIHINETFSFVTAKGNWINSEGNGRFLLINPEDSVYHLFSPSQPESYFPDSTVKCVYVQEGEDILIGTGSGLYEFNEETWEHKNISEDLGLKDDVVNAIVKDKKGRYWMALNTDILCWNREENTTTRYGAKVGFNASKFLPAIGQMDELGNLYFVSMFGIIKFHPDEVNLPKHQILVSLDELSINNKMVGEQKQTEFLNGGYNFDYDQNFLEFEFSTNQVFELSPHQYEYKLEGLNERWISCGANNSVRFDNLQNGDYTLKFKVTNAYGTCSEIFEVPFSIAKPFWQRWWFILLISLCGIGLIYLIVKGRMNALKKRSELLEQTVTERTAEVVEQKKEAEKQREEAEHQKEIVEEKQKEITDSITYAKRIQDAILPSKELINKALPNSFVMYRPKDIVAGDFYWLEPLSDDEVIFAAADCTGHGVPGAMVSVVCNNALNRTVREFGIKNPALLLDKTRELVVEQFEQRVSLIKDASGHTIKDGMDIAVCKLNKKSKVLEYAGANNPLWLIRDGELIETKGNKQPVGKFDPSSPFTSHEFKVQAEDAIYIFSDGYADQFGGEKGKKFKSSSLKKLLLSIHKLPLDKQLEELEKNFDDWKGSFEQLDDVCLIGFKIV